MRIVHKSTIPLHTPTSSHPPLHTHSPTKHPYNTHLPTHNTHTTPISSPTHHQEVCMRNAAGHPAAPLSSLQGTQYARLSTTLPCHFLHAGKSCGSHAQEFVWQAYARALPVYVVVVLCCLWLWVGGLICIWTCHTHIHTHTHTHTHIHKHTHTVHA